MRSRMGRTGRAGAVAAGVLAVMCGPGFALAAPQATPAPDALVVAGGFRYLVGEDYVTEQSSSSVAWPLQLIITRGTTLTFANLDPAPHTLTSDTCTPGDIDIAPPPPPIATVADAFDNTIAPVVFGQHELAAPNGRCLFDSRGGETNAFTSQGSTDDVDTSALPVGDYPFHCLVHHYMQGTLHVVPND